MEFWRAVVVVFVAVLFMRWRAHALAPRPPDDRHLERDAALDTEHLPHDRVPSLRVKAGCGLGCKLAEKSHGKCLWVLLASFLDC